MQTNALRHLEGQRQKLLTTRQRQLDAFVGAAATGKQKRLTRLFARIRQTNDFLQTLGEIESGLADDNDGAMGQRYAVSSLFLHECFKKLTADADEQFFFITGSEVDGVLVLDQMAEFAHEIRTRLGVTGDTRATHGLLIKLEHFGHRLLAHFHSHPGIGAGMTRPSGTDMNFQGRLERAGHLAVMAIFSQDGYVRFLRLDGNVDIEIHGKGVERHATGIYRLTEIYQA
jgi:hypothetical protein